MEREEMEDLIRQVIAEERHESLAHPARREKFTRYTDPDGKTWMSATMDRAEIAQKMIGFVIASCTLLGVINYAILTFSVRPAVRNEIDARIGQHEDQARTKMNEMLPYIVKREEWVAWTSDKSRRWQQQDALNEALENRLTRIEEKLDRLIERGR